MQGFLRRGVIRGISGALSAFVLILAFLKWETAYASIPGDVSGQITSLIRIGGTGWFLVLTMFVVGIILFAIAVGPNKLGAWRKAASDWWHSNVRQINQLQTENERLRASLKNLAKSRPSGTRAEGTLTVEYPDSPPEAKQLKEENERLKKEIERLRAEEHRNLQDQRRKRIEEWRSVIRNLDSGAVGFAGTDTYSQMKPYVQSEVVEMFEAPRTVHIGNEARGDTTYKYTLLDEVARIEKEWGLI